MCLLAFWFFVINSSSSFNVQSPTLHTTSMALLVCKLSFRHLSVECGFNINYCIFGEKDWNLEIVIFHQLEIYAHPFDKIAGQRMFKYFVSFALELMFHFHSYI